MRWLVDECIHSAIVERLRGSGHDVLYAAETARQSADSWLLQRASDDQRILVTDDKDFGEMVFRRERESCGIVLFRIPPSQWPLKWKQLEGAIADYGESLAKRYTVIEPGRVRSQALDRG